MPKNRIFVRVLLWALVLTGAALLLIGAQFYIAGMLPTLDPTPETSARDLANVLAGGMCVRWGLAFSAIGVIGFMIRRLAAHPHA